MSFKTSVTGDTTYFQPIIRGIQNVGSVQILYRYNCYDKANNTYVLPLSNSIIVNAGQESGDTNAIKIPEAGIPVAGFRLDSEFLRANPQIASSFTIPILGGGGVSLTNNNRTGTLNLVCARVAAPNIDDSDDARIAAMVGGKNEQLGVKDENAYWDFVTLAQIQQGQEGGDAYGSTITIVFKFCGVTTKITFEGCTIATVDPIGLAGNDAVNYAIAVNYLNWTIEYGAYTSLAGS